MSQVKSKLTLFEINFSLLHDMTTICGKVLLLLRLKIEETEKAAIFKELTVFKTKGTISFKLERNAIVQFLLPNLLLVIRLSLSFTRIIRCHIFFII